jgi:hypothetical protein
MRQTDMSRFMCISLEIRARYTYIRALQESVLILIKSILVFYTQSLFPSFNSRFCSPENSMLLLCHAASRLRKRPMALSIDSPNGVTHASRGNSASKFQGLEVLSLPRLPTSNTHEGVQGDVIANSTPYAQLPTDAPTRARNSFFGSKVTHFVRDPSHHINTPTCISTRRSTSKGGNRNGLLIAFLEESRMSTSSVSTGRLRSDSSSGAEASGSQKNKMTTRKGRWSNQPRLTCVTPIALLCSWVLHPIEV